MKLKYSSHDAADRLVDLISKSKDVVLDDDAKGKIREIGIRLSIQLEKNIKADKAFSRLAFSLKSHCRISNCEIGIIISKALGVQGKSRSWIGRLIDGQELLASYEAAKYAPLHEIHSDERLAICARIPTPSRGKIFGTGKISTEIFADGTPKEMFSEMLKDLKIESLDIKNASRIDLQKAVTFLTADPNTLRFEPKWVRSLNAFLELCQNLPSLISQQSGTEEWFAQSESLQKLILHTKRVLENVRNSNVTRA